MSVDRERIGRVELVTINRPEARNAIDGPTATALDEIFNELETDPHTMAVVLTGSGDKAFSAGLDLKAFASGQLNDIIRKSTGFAGITQRQFPKPLIAAVNGAALAGGLEIMLSCDLVVAVEQATFGIPEVKRGLIAAAGALIRLPKRLPLSIALELAFTGEPINAKRALELGLINRVVPRERLLEEAIALAEQITQNAPLALIHSKKIMYGSLGIKEEDAWKLNNESVPVIFASKDAIEGAVAFAEKRPAQWTGT